MLRNGAGPGCLVTGGAHGDEWEGQIVAARLARETSLADIRGTLVILPHFNMPACEGGTRLSPLDGGNLNLTWPAAPGAGSTGQIAAFVEAELLPRISHWIDLHTGGRTLVYAPRPAIHLSVSRELNRRAFDALAAFGAAENLVFEVQEARSASTAAQRHGVVYVYGEFGGGSLVVDRRAKLALAHFRCRVWSCGAEASRAEEVELCSTVHLAFDELELGDMALDLAVGPWQAECGGDCQLIGEGPERTRPSDQRKHRRARYRGRPRRAVGSSPGTARGGGGLR